MPIGITNLINQYLEDYKRQKKPKRCKLCKCKGCLNWHGSYFRHVLTLSGKYKISIKRVRCKECGGTFPLLPDFILKYYRYGADVILLAVEEQKKETHEKVASDLCQNYGWEMDSVTVWLWKKKISTSTLRKFKRRLE